MAALSLDARIFIPSRSVLNHFLPYYNLITIQRGSNMEGHTHDIEAYEAPVVIIYGNLAELTAGNDDGNLTDELFPPLTPKSDLTFSG